MLDELTASRFDGKVGSGKTEPLYLAGTSNSLETLEVVSKFSSNCEAGVSSLIREVISALLAADLGLLVPEPHLIRIEESFIESVLDPQLQDVMKTSNKVAFASTKLPYGFTTISAARGLRSADERKTAANIFAFDALICNPDRRLSNPNCLTRNDDFAIIDHELAFPDTSGIIGWLPPWKFGSLKNMATPSPHLFYSVLKGKNVDFSEFGRNWQNITDQRLQSYKEALPSEWNGQLILVDEILNQIVEIRKNISECIDEICRVLE